MKHRPPDAIAPLGGLDYLAKDYASFLQLMYDTMAKEVPLWRERNPADLGVTVMEALALAADHLSYRQDAVANEAYVATARNRVSIARHLRLLGYRLHQGCNARVWLSFQVGRDLEGTLTLPPGCTVTSSLVGDPATTSPAQLPDALGTLPASPGSVFQTLSEAVLDPALDELHVHDLSAPLGVLAEGTDHLLLRGHVHGLHRGDAILFRSHGAAGECHVAGIGQPPRHALAPEDSRPITEIVLADGDTLPFPIRAAATLDGNSPAPITVHANLVLAEHGTPVRELLGRFGDAARHALTLAHRDLLWGEPYDAHRSRSCSAGSCLEQDPTRALPRMSLIERTDDGSPDRRWLPHRDLVDCGPLDLAFTLDTADDGTCRLRFGDGVHGRQPTPGAELEAIYLVGDPSNAKVGPDILTRLDLTSIPGIDPHAAASVAVHNPLPSAGQVAPEAADRARILAPHVARQPRGLVTGQDCAARAARFETVLRTLAQRRWTGSWSTDRVLVQRSNALPVDAQFKARLQRHLGPRLLVDRELEIREAPWLGIDLAIHLHVPSNRSPDTVRRAVRHSLLGDAQAAGPAAFFHPDHFGFGEVLHLDTILDRVMSVPGVAFAEARRFRAWASGLPPGPALDEVDPGPGAILRLADDPGRPELGRLILSVEGEAP